jgi:hypothetical protein
VCAFDALEGVKSEGSAKAVVVSDEVKSGLGLISELVVVIICSPEVEVDVVLVIEVEDSTVVVVVS